MTVLLALFLLAGAQVAWAQEKKEGEAQAVLFDERNWPILKFANKRADKGNCGLFVGYALTGSKQEEAFRLRVSHMHSRSFFQGVVSYPEDGWLYITPSRIVFVVDRGDASHGFDAPRTSLKDKPVTKFVRIVAGMQLNFRESPSASDTGDQKFAFLLFGEKKCGVRDPEPYTEFVVRAVKDFDGALAEFKQLAAALKESGKVEQAPASLMPPGGLAPQAR